MEEKVYFTDNLISVTSSRIILGATTYALRNVSSVRMAYDVPGRLAEIVLILIGFVSLVSGIVMGKNGIACIGLGVLLGIIGVIIYFTKKTTYIVQLGTNAGEHKAYTSTNQEYISNVVKSINEAIIEYK